MKQIDAKMKPEKGFSRRRFLTTVASTAVGMAVAGSSHDAHKHKDKEDEHACSGGYLRRYRCAYFPTSLPLDQALARHPSIHDREHQEGWQHVGGEAISHVRETEGHLELTNHEHHCCAHENKWGAAAQSGLTLPAQNVSLNELLK